MIGLVPTALAVLLVLIVGLAAKLPEAVLPIGTDTGMYATYGRMILQGARPYVDFYDVHPPLAYYYWAAVQAAVGTDWSRACLGSWGTLAPQPCISLLAHALDLGLSLIAALLVYAIARAVGLRRGVGLLASVLVAWFANASMLSMEGSNPTKLTLVPSTLAVYAYVRGLGTGSSADKPLSARVAVGRTCGARPGPGPRPKTSTLTTFGGGGPGRGWLGWAFVSGMAGLGAGLAKQPGLMTLVALVAYTLPSALSAAPARRRLLAMSLGAAATGLLTALFLWRVGSLGGFIDEAWRYNAERFLIGYWQTPAGLTSPATRIDRVLSEAAALLFVGALLGAVTLWVGPARPGERLLLVWGVFSLAAIAGFREFAQVVPSLSLLAALGIGRLWDAATRDGLGLGRPVAGRLSLIALLGTIFLLSSSFQLIETRRAIYERGPRARPSDPDQIAAFLRQQAPPGPIFAWGNAGQIYALSGRQPATRFVIAEFTNTTSPRPLQSRNEVISDLEARPPSAIVVDPHADEPGLRLLEFPGLAQVLDRCYHRVSAGAVDPGWGVYVPSSGDRTCITRVVASVPPG
jgi:hypothetical protein